MKLPPALRGVAGAAVLIGVITVFARLAGFIRTLVYSQSVTNTCLSDAYYKANMIPNIVFEIVAGGALASVVVPILAGPVERADREQVRRTVSAMLTWLTFLLLPLSVLTAVAAGPLMGLLVQPGAPCGHDAMVRVTADMLVVFAPQILVYGLVVVLYGVLQSHHRFTGPAVAPLISSLVVIGAYLAYVPLHVGRFTPLGEVPSSAVMILSVGTTLGVVALLVTAVVAAWPLRLKPRLRLRFPPGVASRARRLAMAGVATVAAQQVATIGVMVLSDSGTAGALTRYQFAWAVFLLPWAVLAVPIATSAYPVLSAQAAERRAPGAGSSPFDRTVAATTRAVLLASSAGAAVLIAVAVPAAHFLQHGKGAGPQEELQTAILLFAPGLLGYGLVAHLGRALYACDRGRASAAAVVIGWLAVLAADVALVPVAHRTGRASWVTGVLGLGNTIGMTVAGALLVMALVRARGGTAVAGAVRATAAGLAGAVVAGLAGYGVAVALGTGGQARNVAVAAVAAGCAGAVFLAVAYLFDRSDLHAVLRRRTTGGQTEQPQPENEDAPPPP